MRPRVPRIPAALGVAVLLLTLSAVPAGAQIPEEFENLKVLPEDIEPQRLVEIMRNFSTALGVRCPFCHVGEEGKPLATYDFASDAKGHKEAARVMMKMVSEINGKHLSQLEDSDVRVRCVTCHHGVVHPRTLDEILSAAYGRGGVESVVARYRELRDEHYGSSAYDFSEVTLTGVAEKLVADEKLEDAAAVGELNAEFHPDATYVHYFLGDVYERLGKKDKAVQSFQRSVQADPENRWAQQRLKKLQGGD